MNARMSELYNLKDERRQLANLSAGDKETAVELHKMLVEVMKQTNVAVDMLNLRLELRLWQRRQI